MKLDNLPPAAIDWTKIPVVITRGASGEAKARTRRFDVTQLRFVEYSPGYIADGWCSKGHIVFVVAGAAIIEHANGERLSLVAGMSYQVGDGGPAHRLSSPAGATLFIVD